MLRRVIPGFDMASASPDETASAAQDLSVDLRFADLQLAPAVLEALTSVGYESPSPIQARTIPPLLEGRDVLGQAQTGTGKTAAFSLPILSKINLAQTRPQALILAPTRELAIQVAEALQKYAARLPGFHVLPIYGGQSYEPQLRGLKRGAHIVVGTPGRVVDHIKRGSLKLDSLRHVVLDEADEMLRMGFIEDVEWVLQQAPAERQIALFSATMPPPIRRVAQTYLREPVEISIRAKTTTATNIRQRYWLVSGMSKLEALTRFLEAETFDAMIVFARTKAATTELADKLEARGFAASALNGDMQQADRERAITKLKEGVLDIVVATDVAARGLDVERISHVVNYDIPTDTESYVHRIGRTGRAGRSGDAILFVSPRERHMLKAIERATRQPIEAIAAPSSEVINRRRVQRFKQSISDALTRMHDGVGNSAQYDVFRNVLAEIETESGAPLIDIAAALASMAQGDRPLLMVSDEPTPMRPRSEMRPAPQADRRPAQRREAAEPEPSAFPMEPKTRERPERAQSERVPERSNARKPRDNDDELETFRVEVGHRHGVKPSNLVGAIANEAGLDSQHIGRIEIYDDHSTVDLPVGMPRGVFRDLQKVWVCGRQLKISRAEAAEPPPKRKKP
jgi:ATP-dependent RNA helicase DeaD